MPYINQEDRKRLDPHIEKLAAELDPKSAPGELNYVIFRIIWIIWHGRSGANLPKNKPSYTLANAMMGVLECVKSEFYRRCVIWYEDKKLLENGDIEE